VTLRADRENANAAASTLLRRQRRYRRSENDLGADIAAWRPALVVGTGLAAGALLGRLRISRIARAVVATVNITKMVVRSSIALAALFGRRQFTDEATSGQTRADQGSKPLA